MGKAERNRRNKRKKADSSSDEEFLNSLPNKKRGPADNIEGSELGELQVSEILNRINAVLYEEDSQIFDYSSLNESSENNQLLNSKPEYEDKVKKEEVKVGKRVDIVGEPDKQLDSVDKSDKSVKPIETYPKSVKMGEKAVPSPTNADIVSHLMKIESSLNDVNTKLKKLDTLEVKVNDFDKELKRLWVHVEDKTKITNDKINTIDERVEGLEFAEGLSRDKLTQLEEQNEKLKDTISYLQSQSMRNNLVFCNIKENPDEKPLDTEEIIRHFMVEKLELAKEIVDQMKLERVHRMGAKSRNANFDRKIVCKFNLFTDREMVRKKRHKLEQTNYYIHEQFPPEIVAKRKKLIQKLKDAKAAGKAAWLSYDTLYIDGKPQKND